MAYYLVERYIPSLTAAELVAAITRMRTLPEGDVRHVWTVLIRDEDTCLSVFEGPDAAAVKEANARATFPLDRVVEVIPIPTAVWRRAPR